MGYVHLLKWTVIWNIKEKHQDHITCRCLICPVTQRVGISHNDPWLFSLPIKNQCYFLFCIWNIAFQEGQLWVSFGDGPKLMLNEKWCHFTLPNKQNFSFLILHKQNMLRPVELTLGFPSLSMTGTTCNAAYLASSFFIINFNSWSFSLRLSPSARCRTVMILIYWFPVSHKRTVTIVWTQIRGHRTRHLTRSTLHALNTSFSHITTFVWFNQDIYAQFGCPASV